MANITFNDLEQTFNNDAINNSSSDGIEFFRLQPGESAIVRFNISSINDFDIKSTHRITVGNASFPNRSISCLRQNPKLDAISICPLCARGEETINQIYITLIQYENENGQIISKPKVWERSAYTYARLLKEYLDNYGDLRNIICKITRDGSGKQTRYNIAPNLSPAMYPENVFVKDFSAFTDFKSLGRIVLDKSYDEIVEFLTTGTFPVKSNVSNNNMSNNSVLANDANIPFMKPMNNNNSAVAANTFTPIDDSDPFEFDFNAPIKY